MFILEHWTSSSAEGSGIIPIHTKSLSLAQHRIPGIGRLQHFGHQCCRGKIALAGDRTHNLLTQRLTCYQLRQRAKPVGKGSNHQGQSQNTLLHWHYPAFRYTVTHCTDLYIVHIHCCVLPILLCGFYYCAPFSPCPCHWHGEILAFASTVLLGSQRACYYNNTMAISRTLLPPLESIPSFFFCGNRKMRPPPQVRLNLDFSLLLLLKGDVSLNSSPSVCGLHLGTVNARSTWNKAPPLVVYFSIY